MFFCSPLFSLRGSIPMEPLHWWQRCSTPLPSKNPFKQDLEPFETPLATYFFGDNQPSQASENALATVIRPVIGSKNPFRNSIQGTNTNPFSHEHATNISSERKTKRPVKVPDDYDGKQPLREYLMHFETCASINGWHDGEKAMFLAASLKGDSRKLLAGLPPEELKQYSKIVERLDARFGVEKQAELHQARLHNRRQKEGESLQMLASDVRSLVDLAYQDVALTVQERFAVQHFVDALNDKEDRLHLRRSKPSSLDEALSLARELESLRLLDSNDSLKRGNPASRDFKVRKIEEESSDLKEEFLNLKNKILEQQNQLEAQQAIIKQLNDSLIAQGKVQGSQTKGNQRSQGAQQIECWNCGEGGHVRRNCPKPRKSQSSGNEYRVSPRVQGGAQVTRAQGLEEKGM